MGEQCCTLACTLALLYQLELALPRLEGRSPRTLFLFDHVFLCTVVAHKILARHLHSKADKVEATATATLNVKIVFAATYIAPGSRSHSKGALKSRKACARHKAKHVRRPGRRPQGLSSSVRKSHFLYKICGQRKSCRACRSCGSHQLLPSSVLRRTRFRLNGAPSLTYLSTVAGIH
eukprot:3902152-Pleurochrysis_carterae.AAC.1